MKNVLIVGATSAMATAVAKKFAEKNSKLFLVARNKEKLAYIAKDLEVRGAAKVVTFEMDINDIEHHSVMLEQAEMSLDGFDTVLLAHGTLPSQTDCETNVFVMLQEFNTNALSTIALLTEISNILEPKKRGTIAVISSVAGDRGRPSNYVYGSAKAAVSTFLEGLAARMFKSGVSVLDIRPGFVATPMTQDLDLPKALIVEPSVIANDIMKAIEKRKQVIYTPTFWKYIMYIIKALPKFIFNRVNL